MLTLSTMFALQSNIIHNKPDENICSVLDKYGPELLRPMLTIFKKGGPKVKLQCLLDTGACVSLIRGTNLKLLGLSVKDLDNTKVNLRTANDGGIKVLGQIKLWTTCLCPRHGCNKFKLVNFIVADKLTEDVIIGN